jgi:RHS repeat-associated protein
VWDVRSKLKSKNTAGTSVTYKHDAYGRRVVRSGSQTTFYIYSGSALIGEVTAGSPSAAYTWGMDGLSSERLIEQNRTLFYHFGSQGETRQMTDASGALTNTYQYEAYGKMVQAVGPDSNPFQYGGKFGYYTDGSDLLAGARWYSPALMRWLTRDPAGYAGGDNLYRYVDGNPVQRTDPSGLDGNDEMRPEVVEAVKSIVDIYEQLDSLQKLPENVETLGICVVAAAAPEDLEFVYECGQKLVSGGLQSATIAELKSSLDSVSEELDEEYAGQRVCRAYNACMRKASVCSRDPVLRNDARFACREMLSKHLPYARMLAGSPARRQ